MLVMTHVGVRSPVQYAKRPAGGNDIAAWIVVRGGKGGGVHSEINPYTVETVIRRGIDHAREHTEQQIRRARSRCASAA
jgi:hypothetical protein